jgi:hypothetical protein
MPTLDDLLNELQGRRSARVERKREGDDPRSGSWQGLPKMLTSLGPGLVEMGRSGLETGHGLLQMIPTAVASAAGVKPDDLRDDPLSRLLVNADVVERGGDAKKAWSNVEDMFPLLHAVAESGGVSASRWYNTVHQAANTVSPLNIGNQTLGDNEYAKAWSERRLGPMVVEDLANAALLGYGVSGGLNAAAKAGSGAAATTAQGGKAGVIGARLAPHAPKLEAAAARLGNASITADRIAAAPFTGPRAAARLAAKGVDVGPVKVRGALARNPESVLAQKAAGRESLIAHALSRTPGVGPAYEGMVARRGHRTDQMMTHAEVASEPLLHNNRLQDAVLAGEALDAQTRSRVAGTVLQGDFADPAVRAAARTTLDADASKLARLETTRSQLAAQLDDPTVPNRDVLSGQLDDVDRNIAVLQQGRAGVDADTLTMLDDYYRGADPDLVAAVDADVAAIRPAHQREANERLRAFGENEPGAAPQGGWEAWHRRRVDDGRPGWDELTMADVKEHAAVRRRLEADKRATRAEIDRLVKEEADIGAVLDAEARLADLGVELERVKVDERAVTDRVARMQEQGFHTPGKERGEWQAGALDVQLRRQAEDLFAKNPTTRRSQIGSESPVRAVAKSRVDAEKRSKEMAREAKKLEQDFTAPEFDPSTGYPRTGDPTIDGWTWRWKAALEYERLTNPMFAPPKARQAWGVAELVRDELVQLRDDLGAAANADPVLAAKVARELQELGTVDLERALELAGPDLSVTLVGEGGGRRGGVPVEDGGPRRHGGQLLKSGVHINRAASDQMKVVQARRVTKAHNESVNRLVDDVGMRRAPDGSPLTDEWAQTQKRPDGRLYGSLDKWAEDHGMRVFKRNTYGERLREVADAASDTDLVMLADELNRYGTGEAQVLLPEPAYLALMDTLPPAPPKAATTAKAVKAWDKMLSAWKISVLPLSPRWHSGNMLGNALMVTAGSDLTLREVRRALPEAHRKAGSPGGRIAPVVDDAYEARLATTSNVLELAQGTSQAKRMDHIGRRGRLMTVDPERAGQRLPRAREAARRGIDTSYSFNQYVDNVSHLLVYLAKKNRRKETLAGLRKDFEAGRISEARYKQLRDFEPTPEQMVTESVRVAGDFTNMPAYQQKYLRRVVPFVAWYKHITRLVAGLPVENPYRAMWLLHLSDLWEQEDRPE